MFKYDGIPYIFDTDTLDDGRKVKIIQIKNFALGVHEFFRQPEKIWPQLSVVVIFLNIRQKVQHLFAKNWFSVIMFSQHDIILYGLILLFPTRDISRSYLSNRLKLSQHC